MTDLPFWRQRLAVEGKQGIFIFILGHLKGLKLSLGKRRKGYPRHCCCCCCCCGGGGGVVVIVVGGGDVVVLYNVMLGELSQQ